jgi:hypothetical protein
VVLDVIDASNVFWYLDCNFPGISLVVILKQILSPLPFGAYACALFVMELVTESAQWHKQVNSPLCKEQSWN